MPADGPPRTQHIGPDHLTALQRLVGGHIEGVSRDGWHAYINDEGKLLDLPVNLLATILLFPDHSDLICGAAVLLGDGPAGDEADAPAAVVESAATVLARYRQID
jgi:Domain of unknown function (DUF3846)